MTMISAEVPLEAPFDRLDERQELALLHRILHRIDYTDGLGAGHISMRLDDGTILITARNRGWDEMCASDLVLLDEDGVPLMGGGANVGRAAHVLHSVIHRHRPDVKVAVHNHPRWATIWAAAGRVPPAYDQYGSFVGDDIVLSGEFRDDVSNAEEAMAVVAAISGAPKALLRNHGVLVFGASVRQAHVRSASLEHRCKIAWHVEALGGGTQVAPEVVSKLSTKVQDGVPFHFEYAARREIKADPSVLD